jgi:beta-galactosidase
VEGQAVATGTVETLNAAPQKSVVVDLPIPAIDAPGKDIFINVSYVLKTPDGLLPAGHEVAYDQIVVQEGSLEPYAPSPVSCSEAKVSHVETASAHVFAGSYAFAGINAQRISDWKVTFDKSTGFLTSFIAGGDEMMSEPLMPEFARALVENDMGAKMHRTMAVWRYPEFNLKSMEAKEESNGWLVVAEYAPIADGAAIVTLNYLIHPDGTLECREIMKDAGGLDKAPDLFRFGMKFAMPGKYSVVDFYGKGPWENYSDRNSSAMVGHYVQTVNEQYHYGYVRTQESGTHTGLKYLRLLDAAGNGLEITSDGRFSASALPFPMNVLDCMENGTPSRENKSNTQVGEPRHSLSLKAAAHENDRAAGQTYVNFDLVQAGVGGINSWGRLPLEQYRVKAGERYFYYIIRPISN